ncbi:MAG: hypothetical protein JXL97_03950 [Bacteroidales bacterium]|nr:hypothetical protein [Bacteroidales bacterium]
MKNLYYIFTIIFLMFFLNSCKEKKIQTATEQLIGTWTGDITAGEWCDTNDYNKVILELQNQEIALLNYSGPNGNRWTTPYECKWWLEQEKEQNPLVFFSAKEKYFFLYIIRFDTLCDPCRHCAWDGKSCYYGWLLPDTTVYQLVTYEELKIKTVLEKLNPFWYGGGYDLLFSEEDYGENIMPSKTKILQKQWLWFNIALEFR